MTIEVKNEPLTYRPDRPFSYFRDRIFGDHASGGQRAAERLQRHAQEMELATECREAKARRELRAAGIEYRVEPYTGAGHGGYFTIPLWLNQYFASANRPPRVLAGLMPKFPMPAGVSSISVPVITTGTAAQAAPDLDALPSQDIVDAYASTTTVTIEGEADVARQLLEQSPVGPHLDWSLFLDLSEAYDSQLETQLIAGLGPSYRQILGVGNVSGIVSVPYTQGTPTQSGSTGLWPLLGELVAQIGDGRDKPPEAWLMRTARWSWLNAGFGTDNIPFGVLSPNFLGSSPGTPWPIGPLYGLPVFLDDAIPANLGAGKNQDVVIALRPTDLLLFESAPITNVFREVGSGNLTARIQLHNKVACISNRRPAGIGVIGGSGLAIQAGF